MQKKNVLCVIRILNSNVIYFIQLYNNFIFHIWQKRLQIDMKYVNMRTLWDKKNNNKKYFLSESSYFKYTDILNSSFWFVSLNAPANVSLNVKFPP